MKARHFNNCYLALVPLFVLGFLVLVFFFPKLSHLQYMANIFCCVILHVSNTQLFMTASVIITNSVAGKSHYNSLWSPRIPRAPWMCLCWGFNMQHECAFEVDFSILPPHWTLFPTMEWSRSTDTIFFQAVTSVEGVMFWIVKSLIPSALQFSIVTWITLCSLILEIQWPLPKSKCIVQIIQCSMLLPLRCVWQ